LEIAGIFTEKSPISKKTRAKKGKFAKIMVIYGKKLYPLQQVMDFRFFL